MSGRQAIGAMILAVVFGGLFVAYGLTGGWMFAITGFGGGIVLGLVVIYALKLVIED